MWCVAVADTREVQTAVHGDFDAALRRTGRVSSSSF